jgi:dihydrofolate reductase
MRELILKMFMSLDGFVGSTDGDPTALMPPPDPVAKAWNAQRAWETSLHVVGSRTFRMWAGYWPTATDAFAAAMNQIPKAVFSRRGPAILEAARAIQDNVGTAARPGAESWSQAYVASGDLVEEITRLKAQDGKPIFAYGGVTFARSLLAHGLVDQFELAILPIALGQGVSLFSELRQPRHLALISSKAFPRGTVVQVYRPA